MSSVERAMRRMQHWRARYEAGRLRPLGIRQPTIRPGERFAVRIAQVGVHEQDLRLPLAEWTNLPGGAPRPLSHKPDGGLYVTSERAFVTGNSPSHVLHEWRWSEVPSVDLLPGYIGLVLHRQTEPSTVDVVGSEWTSAAPTSAPNRRTLALRWLQAAAAFYDHAGRLDEWWAQLPYTRRG